ncbi:MAG: hypothetical protein ACTHJM_04065 [Marmoricola sp.]
MGVDTLTYDVAATAPHYVLRLTEVDTPPAGIPRNIAVAVTTVSTIDGINTQHLDLHEPKHVFKLQ